MRPSFIRRMALRLLGTLALLGAGLPALAQDDSSLLPVTEAYQLKGEIDQPGTIKLHWTIAPDYYLYRGRLKFTAGAGVELGPATLPDGAKHHDEYLGDVEIYHHSIDASLPYKVVAGSPGAIELSVQYQGCHEVDPKICYPPHTEKLSLALPTGPAPSGSAAAASGAAQPAGPPSPSGPGHAGLADALGQIAAAPRPSGAALPPEQAFRLEALARSPSQLLLRWSMPKGYYLYKDKTHLSASGAGSLELGEPAWPTGVAEHDANFGDVIVYFDQLELPVPLHGDAEGARQITVHARFQGCQQNGLCYPPMERDLRVDLAPGSGSTATAAPHPASAVAAGGAAPGLGLLGALLLAFVGGLILNLMPCVLPVLSIKAVGLLESGESSTRARHHALMYTAGVLVSFVVLGLGIIGLRGAGHALGWGAQLQQPLLVGLLACLMLAVGLSMSGVVQFGASLGNTGQSLARRSGPSGDFFTGVLAVVVASPCTAPFMGGALAYAFAAPMLTALLVFLALGFGLALPFLAVGFIPALARRLPRPGAWMETLKQVLAFPMYLTAVWLVWVLAHQRGADAVGLVLVAAVLLAMTLWWFERSRYRSKLAKAWLLPLSVLTVLPLYFLAHLPPPLATTAADAGSVAYSPDKLAELRRAGSPVFVDMTADWCVTCKANEHAVLDKPAFRDLLRRTGTVYMVGDWTDVNPTIQHFLDQYHSPGVPLYVIFPRQGEGRQLPNVLTQSLLERALTEAAR